jgi:hypothetical protein
MVNHSNAFLDHNRIESISIDDTQMTERSTSDNRMVGHLAQVAGDDRVRPVLGTQSLDQLRADLTQRTSN